LTSPSTLFNGDDYSDLVIEVTQESARRTHIKIYPPSETRWEIPESLIPRPGGIYNKEESQFPGGTQVGSRISSNPFNLQLYRYSSGVLPGQPNDVIFNLTNDLIFQSQYIEFNLQIPNDVIASYGFGESSRFSQASSASMYIFIINNSS
jgi:alpha-glucosidase